MDTSDPCAQPYCEGFALTGTETGQADGCCCNAIGQCASENCDWSTMRCAEPPDPSSSMLKMSVVRATQRSTTEHRICGQAALHAQEELPSPAAGSHSPNARHGWPRGD